MQNYLNKKLAIVFSKNGCTWCDKAVKLLESKSYNFYIIKVDENIENLENMRKYFPDAKTVPQIIIGDELIGGFNNLQAYFS